MTSRSRMVMAASSVLAVLAAGRVANAGLFGPSKAEVLVEVGAPCACTKEAAKYGCCHCLCFNISNKATKTLVSVTFSVTGTMEGRSTVYKFDADPSGGGRDWTSDLVIAPSQSRAECFQGFFNAYAANPMRPIPG